MGHRIFLSYSSKDQAAAEEICKALEAQGIGCWIAPRDIVPGSQWGGSIVEAIERCDAVLVVFSDASNESPQVAREMEVAVAQRRPLIPVRVADAMPTDDMKYFLGVSHWLNAYERPLPSYLSEIVAATKRVLDKQTGPLARVIRAMPRTRNGQLLAGGIAVVFIAALTASLMRPAQPSFKIPENPFVGRWEASLPNGSGGTNKCVVDIQGNGQANYSDDCPFPLAAASGTINAMPNNVWAPNLFHDGDDGTFLIQGGTLHGATGAYRLKGRKLIVRDAVNGEVTWKKISSSTPLRNAVDDIIPAKIDWPIKNLPDIAHKSTDYVRGHWQKDAVLLGIEIKLLDGAASYSKLVSPAGAVELQMSYYSPNTQQGLSFTPAATYSTMYGMGVVDWNANDALPEKFLDLPDAVEIVRQHGMRAKQIKAAELRNWGQETTAGDARMSGIEWMIDSALDERSVVRGVP